MSVSLTVSYRDSLNQTPEGLQHSRRCTELMVEEKKIKNKEICQVPGPRLDPRQPSNRLFLAVWEARAISAAVMSWKWR